MSDALDISLLADSVRYLSEGDEKAFFHWIDSLPFMTSYKGEGGSLCLSVATSEVDEDGLRELIALFTRYGVDLKQLRMFDRPEFSDWLRDDRKYWYKAIFG